MELKVMACAAMVVWGVTRIGVTLLHTLAMLAESEMTACDKDARREINRWTGAGYGNQRSSGPTLPTRP